MIVVVVVVVVVVGVVVVVVVVVLVNVGKMVRSWEDTSMCIVMVVIVRCK